MRKKVSEIDVIIAIAHWLNSNNFTIETISIPRGQGINERESRQKIEKKFSELGIPSESVNFLPFGPDIVAKANNIKWKIECKGLGEGKNATLRNNFDRALSSTVSCYDSVQGIRLGIALPNNNMYCSLVENKIHSALRERLDLWVLFYDLDDGTVKVFGPSEKIVVGRNIVEAEGDWV